MNFSKILLTSLLILLTWTCLWSSDKQISKFSCSGFSPVNLILADSQINYHHLSQKSSVKDFLSGLVTVLLRSKRKHNILRVQISMNEVPLVHLIQALRQLIKHFESHKTLLISIHEVGHEPKSLIHVEPLNPFKQNFDMIGCVPMSDNLRKARNSFKQFQIVDFPLQDFLLIDVDDLDHISFLSILTLDIRGFSNSAEVSSPNQTLCVLVV